jgi:hypothetical protein
MGSEIIIHRAGPVVSSVGALVQLLPELARIGEENRPLQQELFNRTFDVDERPASERAAAAIASMV